MVFFCADDLCTDVLSIVYITIFRVQIVSMSTNNYLSEYFIKILILHPLVIFLFLTNI